MSTNTNIEELIYTFYDEVDMMLRRGMAKGYIEHNDTLTMMRGRIDARRLAQKGGTISAALPCRYYQREDDTILNQILLAGLRLAESISTDSDMQYAIERTVNILAESISPIRLNDLTLSKARSAIDRMTKETYEPLLDIVETLYKSGVQQ